MLALLHHQPAQALSGGDGLFASGNNVYRTFSSNILSAASPLLASSVKAKHVIVKSSPNQETILVGMLRTSPSPTLTMYRWNGYAWNQDWSVAAVDSVLPSFDIAFESLTGNGIVVYSTGAAGTNELAYRVWNSTTSSWGTVTQYNPTTPTAAISAVKLASARGADAIGIAWAGTDRQLGASWWNSTAGFTSEITTIAAGFTTIANNGGSGITNWSFGLTFENTSNRLMLVWGADTKTGITYAIRSAGSAGTWAASVNNTTFTILATDMEVASEYSGNYIAYVNSRTSSEMGIWNGSAWIDISVVDSTINAIDTGSKNITVSWLKYSTTNLAVVTYDDASATGVDWLHYNKANRTKTTGTDLTTSPAPSATNDYFMQLYTNPVNQAQGVLVLMDASYNIFFKRVTYSGSFSWASAEPGGSVLETMPATISQPVGFAYASYTNPLITQYVDGIGNALTNPTFSMNPIAASLICTTSTGTIGSSSKKIRLYNNSSNNNTWVAAIAPTNGAGATWSGPQTFDFNDGGGSPAGCGIGADGDNYAGQLQLDPSSETITPKSGCTTNGLTKGTAAKFSDGTINSITILTAGATSDMSCYFDITGIGASQTIPPETLPGSYSLNLTVTLIAN